MHTLFETLNLASPAPWLLLLGLVGTGCPKPTATEPAAVAEPDQPAAPALASLRLAAERTVEGLDALACGEALCAYTTGPGVVYFDPVTLEPVPTEALAPGQGDALRELLPLAPLEPLPEPEPVGAERIEHMDLPALENPMEAILEQAEGEPVEAEPEPDTLPNPAIAERAAWGGVMEAGRRLPFQRRVPVAGGGMVTYQREYGGGPGKLLRIGGGFRSVTAPGTTHDVSCEGWLAPHPSGLEVYLLLWPAPTLHAYETRSMAQRWSLELPAAAQGLFVDPAGRYALLSLTGTPDPDRLTDYPSPALITDLPTEPLQGAAALPPELPEPVGVVLVDLAAKRISAQAQGAFRGWVATPDGAWLLATHSGILRLEAR
jgi:hypothetical protein